MYFFGRPAPSTHYLIHWLNSTGDYQGDEDSDIYVVTRPAGEIEDVDTIHHGDDMTMATHDAGFDQMVEDEISKRSGAGFA